MWREMVIIGMSAILACPGAFAMDIFALNAEDISYFAEDDVKGSGMLARYNYLGPIGPHYDHRITQEGAVTAIKKTEHGSGTMENEQISRVERVNRWLELDQGWNFTGKRSLASIEENNTMLFSPQSMTVGLGYYARNPLVFNSLLSEKTSAKNYATETSMIHATDRAKAIDKDLDASVSDTYYDLSGWELLEAADIGLSVREDVTEGATHIGVLQGNTEDLRHSARKSPLNDIDQDFLGTFSIDTRMKLSWPVTRMKGDDDWLPCCSDGYLNMPTYYRMGSKGFGSDVKGVFDCTCFTPPSQAQFSRI